MGPATTSTWARARRHVEQFHPVKVILFGSVARGEEVPDSDLDLLVVVDHLDKAERRKLMGRIAFAISAPVPTDINVADVAELEARKDVNGSVHYWPSREGRVVYACAVVAVSEEFDAKASARKRSGTPTGTGGVGADPSYQ